MFFIPFLYVLKNNAISFLPTLYHEKKKFAIEEIPRNMLAHFRGTIYDGGINIQDGGKSRPEQER